MKKHPIKAISENLQISRPTVSRVLRHCAGVDSETRELVLKHACEESVEMRKIHTSFTNGIDIYAILPGVPKYFWGSMLEALGRAAEKTEHSIKYNLYTKLGDERSILHYLDEAEALGARVLLLAGRITPTIEQRLSALVGTCLVLLLSEFCALRHTFYIGADPLAEGRALGKYFRCSPHHTKPLVLLRTDWQANARLRVEGFLAACREQKESPTVIELSLSPEVFASPKLLPAKLAGVLATLSSVQEPCIVYAPVAIPQLPLALLKAGIAERTRVFVHDPESNDACFAAVCRQNVEEQATCAIRAARRYLADTCCPNAKYLYVDSCIETNVKKHPLSQLR